MILLRGYICFVLFSSCFSKMDLNFHLDEIYNSVNNETFTWSTLQNRIKLIVDTLLVPNIGGIYKLYKKLEISSDCYESLQSLIMSLRKEEGWAIQMLDASGKIPSGILEGTMMDFGSYDECLKIKVHGSSKYSKGEQFRGRYCMVGYHSPLLTPLTQKTPDGRSYHEAYGTPPDWAMEILQRAGGYLKRTAFWFGTCVPSTCTEDDVRKISTIVSKPLGFNVSISDCQIDEQFSWPYYSVAAVICLGFLVFLCTVGTLVDVGYRLRRSDSTVDECDSVFVQVLKAFSVLKNTENLFGGNAGGGSLGCFNGIRFLSAMWIILGHTYFYTDTWKYLKYRRLLGFEEQFNGNLPVAVIENFTIPVGSFFFMSGFLLVYTTWKVLEKSDGKFNLLKFFIRKFWRMTPALGLTLALFFSLPLIDSGPIWNSSLNPPIRQCLNLWWTNFLYINNWWNTDEFCLIHTWYLAALMQFHLMGVILLITTYRTPVIGIVLGSTVSVGCALITILLVVRNNFPMPAPGKIKDMDIIEDYNSQIYIKPFAHFTTYLSGMIIGYLFLKYGDRKIAPICQILGWTLAVAGALLSVYGLYGPSESVAVRAIYIVGHRIGWALSIGWMCYACATGIGGIVNRLLCWNAMYPLGQLSYLTYLLHPLVIIYRNASLRERVYYGHTELVFTFFSNTVASLFLAFIGYIAVEMPFAILEKMVFKNRSLKFKTEFRGNPEISAHTNAALSP